MKFRVLIFAAAGLSALLCACSNAPGRPTAGDTPIVPNEITDFNVLYGRELRGVPW